MKKLLTTIFISFTLTLTACSDGNARNLVDAEKSERYGYSKNASQIVYDYGTTASPWSSRKWIAIDADVSSFEVLEEDMGRDNHHLFLANRIIDYVDYDTLNYLEGSYNTYKDKNNVYSRHGLNGDETVDYKRLPHLEIIEEADAKTYHIIGKETGTVSNWAKDVNHIFHDYKVMDVDYNTFKVLTYFLAVDKDFVYTNKGIELIKIPNKNKNSDNFSVLNSSTIYTPKYLYFQHYDYKILEFPIKDVGSIKAFNNGRYFALDGAVYHYGKKIEMADVQTFRSYNPYEDFAKDKNHLYINDKVISNINPDQVSYNEEKRTLQYKELFWNYREQNFTTSAY